jgi:peptide deformylase
MAVLDIVTHPAAILRRKARKVTSFGPELQTMIDDMIETMRAAPGVGLAAPQVDIPLKLAVVEYAEDEDEEKPAPPRLYVLVNPEITRKSEEKEIGTEGCLSIPGFVGDVERSLEVTVKGYNRRGKPIKINAQGWLARIFQHELDHLDGVLFIDHAEKVWKVDEMPYQGAPYQGAPSQEAPSQAAPVD